MHRIDSVAVVDDLIREIESDGIPFMGGRAYEDYAKVVQGIINTPDDKYQTLIKIQSPNQVWQQMTYVMSNLGKGAIFYFVCIYCERRVRYLYARKDK